MCMKISVDPYQLTSDLDLHYFQRGNRILKTYEQTVLKRLDMIHNLFSVF